MAMLAAGSAPRKILMTAGGGEEPWQHTLELVRGLGEAGVEVVLAVTGARPDQLTAALCISGVEVVLAPSRAETSAESAADWLLSLEEARGCDLVQLDGHEHAALPFRSPKVVVAHSCGLGWWQALRGGELPPAWEVHRRRASIAFGAADCVVAPSDWLLSMLDEHYGPLPPSVAITPGLSPAGFSPGEKEPFVMALGDLADEARNTALLARVAPRLPWPVKIAGARAAPGPADGEGALLLGRLGQARLAALYGQAAVFASTARFDTLGLSVHAAALSECALVLPDLPAARELWGGAAVFVAPDDEDALQTALVTLMNQPELAAFLALRAHQRAVCQSATRMVKRYLAVYRQLLAERPRHGLLRELRSSCVS
jgi:glycogen(starch) synthase